MYNFPNFDNDTHFIMVKLVRDLENSLLYEPSVIVNSTEKLMIRTPRYWLIAISA